MRHDTRSILATAEARVATLHRDPEADPADLLAAEQARDYARWEDDNTVPWADSPEDITTRTIDLDGGTAVIEHTGDRVEVTVRLGDRTVLGIALTHMEAANLGRALTSPHGATTGDLFHLADTLDIDAGDILRLSGGAR